MEMAQDNVQCRALVLVVLNISGSASTDFASSLCLGTTSIFPTRRVLIKYSGLIMKRETGKM